METIIIMDAAAKRADLEKKALEKKILEELEKKQMENGEIGPILITLPFSYQLTVKKTV